MPESESLLRTDEGFEAFYTRHYKLVYRTCFSYMKNTADAEDCTEDVFVKVLTGQYSFEDENHEKAWLTVTAMNMCKDKLRHWTHRQVVSLDDCAELVGDGAPHIDETLDAVLKLPPKYKDVIYLHYYMGYKTDRIAEMLEKPPSTSGITCGRQGNFCASCWEGYNRNEKRYGGERSKDGSGD